MKARNFTKETINYLGTSQRNFPLFEIGDTIVIQLRIKEGDKERLQAFEGDVIAKHNNGVASTFTVRKIAAGGVAVERILPYYSPLIDSIEVRKKGDVRRAKLFYLRKRVGKAARLKEKLVRTAASTVAQEESAAKESE